MKSELELYRPPEAPFNPDLRIESRFKNARLYNALMDSFGGIAESRRENKGGHGTLPILAVASEVTGVHYSAIGDLVNLRRSPFEGRSKKNRFTRIARKISAALCLEVEYLFPPYLYSLTFPKLVVHELESRRFVSLEDAKHIIDKRIEASPLVHYEREEFKNILREIMGSLKKREAQVLTMRFNLDGKGEWSFDEIGRGMNISGERVRQIEARALRCLRHPSRSYALRKYRS